MKINKNSNKNFNFMCPIKRFTTTFTAMFSNDKVTEIFCLADEFCKFFDALQEKSMLEECTGISFVDSTPLRV